MLILILSLATILITFWLLLLGRAVQEDYTEARLAMAYDIHCAMQTLAIKEKKYDDLLQHYNGVFKKFTELFYGRSIYKKTKELKKAKERLKNSRITSFELFIISGYVLQREAEFIGKSEFRKKIYTYCFELYGKKHAGYKTNQIFAKILSYPITGLSVVLILGVLLCCADMVSAGIGLTGVGSAIVLVLTYGIYDELSDLTKKRRMAINRQVPNAISKLALLVTSGMIMDRAWKETAYSQDTELYTEMRKTSEELDNLVSPEVAYGGFINRCNTKETAKLASAIMQNRSKGNAEIGRLLKDMAHEVWLERRHTAKRDAEKANSKLMIPTMLLFLAILVMLMVPIAMNFSGI